MLLFVVRLGIEGCKCHTDIVPAIVKNLRKDAVGFLNPPPEAPNS